MSVQTRTRLAIAVLIVCNALLLLGHRGGFSSVVMGSALAVGAGFAVLALATLELPQGDSLHVGTGPLVSAVLLTRSHEGVLGIALGAALVLLIVYRTSRRETTAIDVLRYPLLAEVGFLLASWESSYTPVNLGTGGLLASALLMGLLLVVIDLLSYAAIAAFCRGERLPSAVNRLARLVGSLYLGEASVGVALALVMPPMGLLGAAVLLVLMLLMKHSFGLYLRVRAAYGKTVAVIARLAEFENHESRGHAERVADIASGIGRALRLSQSRLERLGLAALLHDIGKVATGIDQSEPPEHAEIGSRILSSVEFLSDLAPIVGSHHANTMAEGDESDLLLAGIVHVASDFDRLLTAATSRDARECAFDVMRTRSGEYRAEALEGLRKSQGLR